MISPTLRELLRPALLIHTFFWWILTACIVFYVVLAWILARAPDAPAAVASSIELALAGFAIATGAASLLLPRFWLSDERLRSVLASPPDLEALARPQGSSARDELRLQAIQTLTAQEQKLLALPGFYFPCFLVRMVLNESVAVYGLILTILSHTFESVLPFATAGLLLNLVSRPRIEPLLERASHLVR